MRLANQNTLREVIAYFRFKGCFQGLSDLEAYRLILNYQRDKELSLGLHYQGEALKASRPYVLELIKLAYLANSPFKVEDFQELKERLLATGNIADQQEHELAIYEISKRLLKKDKKAVLVSDKDLQFQCIEWKRLNPSGWIGEQNPKQPKIIVDLNLLGSVQNPVTGERTRFTAAPELIYLNSVLGFPYYISVLFALPDGESFKNAQATVDSSSLACDGNTPVQLAASTNGEGSNIQLFISLAPFMWISPDGVILSRDNVLAFERGGDTSQDQQANAPEPKAPISNETLANAPIRKEKQRKVNKPNTKDRLEMFKQWLIKEKIDTNQRLSCTKAEMWKTLQKYKPEVFAAGKDDFFNQQNYVNFKTGTPKTLIPLIKD